nr:MULTISPECIES: SDR family oxidoreductase [Myxococcaceae]
MLVTGANGLVGGRLCELAQRRGHQVIGLGRAARRLPGAWDYVAVDLTRAGDAAAAVARAAPDAVVHAAGMTDVDACERAPEQAHANNAQASETVARAAHAAGAHLVYVSTDYVFDGEAGPYAERARPHPRGAYATSKWEGEQRSAALAPGCAIARTAVVYGWPPAARLNFGAWLVQALSRGEPVRLFEDQQVSPSLAESVAAQLLELCEARHSGVWHTCGAQVLDRVAFGRALCAEFGFDPGLIVPVRVADVALAGPRPLRGGLSCARATAELEARPLPLAEALARFHAEWRAAR